MDQVACCVQSVICRGQSAPPTLATFIRLVQAQAISISPSFSSHQQVAGIMNKAIDEDSSRRDPGAFYLVIGVPLPHHG